jgi:hypothetical protein
MTLPGSASRVFDKTGIHLFKAVCEAVSTLAVDNSWHQLVGMTGASSSAFPLCRLISRGLDTEIMVYGVGAG